MTFSSYLPGEIIKQYFIQGEFGGSSNLPITETLMSGTQVSIDIDSNAEVVLLEFSLQFATTTQDEVVYLRFFRDSTEIFETGTGVEPVTGTVTMNAYTNWIDRPGPGTYTYSVRIQASTSTAFTGEEARTWVRYTKFLLPESLSSFNTSTFTW